MKEVRTLWESREGVKRGVFSHVTRRRNQYPGKIFDVSQIIDSYDFTAEVLRDGIIETMFVVWMVEGGIRDSSINGDGFPKNFNICRGSQLSQKRERKWVVT